MPAGNAGRSSMPMASGGSLPRVFLVMFRYDPKSKAKELCRIVDQHELARSRIGRDLGDEVDQFAIIGHRIVVRVRPVGAPDHALRRMRGKVARKSYCIGIGIFLLA